LRGRNYRERIVYGVSVYGVSSKAVFPVILNEVKNPRFRPAFRFRSQRFVLTRGFFAALRMTNDF
jgi:hypothetical protein